MPDTHLLKNCCYFRRRGGAPSNYKASSRLCPACSLQRHYCPLTSSGVKLCTIDLFGPYSPPPWPLQSMSVGHGVAEAKRPVTAPTRLYQTVYEQRPHAPSLQAFHQQTPHSLLFTALLKLFLQKKTQTPHCQTSKLTTVHASAAPSLPSTIHLHPWFFILHGYQFLAPPLSIRPDFQS